MFQKTKYRLRSKDVRFLVRKRQIVFTPHFSILWFKQYLNLPFHQVSVNVWLAFNKSAVARHKLKRIILSELRSCLDNNTSINGKYYKLFFSLNKRNIEDWARYYVSWNKLSLKEYVKQVVHKSLAVLKKKLT